MSKGVCLLMMGDTVYNQMKPKCFHLNAGSRLGIFVHSTGRHSASGRSNQRTEKKEMGLELRVETFVLLCLQCVTPVCVCLCCVCMCGVCVCDCVCVHVCDASTCVCVCVCVFMLCVCVCVCLCVLCVL